MSDDHLSLTFHALSDPTRRAILARLAGGERTMTELAAPFDISLPAVSKHVQVLERAGLVRRSRRAQQRPVTLVAEPLREVADWVSRYRQHWEAQLDGLEAYLQTLQRPPPGGS